MTATPTTRDATRRRTSIKLLIGTLATTTEKLGGLIEAARAAEDHVALGYPSWTAYVAAEYADALSGLAAAARRPAVRALAASGMSTRAIAEVAGVNHSTVVRDRQVVQNAPPAGREFYESDAERTDAEAMAAVSGDEFEVALVAAREQGDLSRENVVLNLPEKRVTGTDGKSYPATSATSPPRRRRPLPDAYRDAVYDLDQVVRRIARLQADDRFTSNRELLETRHRHPLTDSVDQLAGVLSELIGGVD